MVAEGALMFQLEVGRQRSAARHGEKGQPSAAGQLLTRPEQKHVNQSSMILLHQQACVAKLCSDASSCDTTI